MNSILSARYYVGVFFIASATLLLEVTLTRIFSVIHFYYFAFLIVSTALFGYGFSGVFLSVSQTVKKLPTKPLVFWTSLFFSVTVVTCYRLILLIPLGISHLAEPVQWIYLALNYLLLSVPFFFSGLTIGVLLSAFPDRIHRLYFADLLGAGIGCFAIVGLIPVLGGSGTILFAAILAAISGCFFAESRKSLVLSIAIIAICALPLPNAENLFPVAGKSEKRYFHDSIEQGKVLFTGWSPGSRIDVVTDSLHAGQGAATIWIDGGTCQSFMRPFGLSRNWENDNVTIAYHLLERPSVMIIGPGGGVDVAESLRAGARKITAVELDPLIAKMVRTTFNDFIGGIYWRPKVHLFNEEGRSFIRRSTERFDLIEQKNNSHPMAVATGALNLTETYLLTKEAFAEYLDHLRPDGILLIKRHGGIRLLNLAVDMLQQRGYSDYWRRLVLLQDNNPNQIFLMKNGVFEEEQLQVIADFTQKRHIAILYSPSMRYSVDSAFTRLMDEAKRKQLVASAPFDLSVPTDDKPFFNHFFRPSALWRPELRRTGTDPFWLQANLYNFSGSSAFYSDLSVYIILAEAILLATVFIVYPLFRMKRSGIAMQGAGYLLGYFGGLGIGFIFVEIVLIQKYILFIGYPIYSVATILFSLLVAAAAGSYLSGRFQEMPFRALRFVVGGVVLCCFFQMWIAPPLFRYFLSAPFAARLLLSILFIAPVGFAMGMAFPLGLCFTSRYFPQFVAWAWGINGYATVLGSVLSIILALNFGFRVVLLLPCAIYILSYFSLLSASRCVSLLK
jgi:Spermine/spermidine synthase domain